MSYNIQLIKRKTNLIKKKRSALSLVWAIFNNYKVSIHYLKNLKHKDVIKNTLWDTLGRRFTIKHNKKFLSRRYRLECLPSECPKSLYAMFHHHPRQSIILLKLRGPL